MAINFALTPLRGTPTYAPVATANFRNPVQARNDPSAVQQAVALSDDAALVLGLGQTPPLAQALTYNAAGLFDRIVDAGTPAAAPYPTQNQAIKSADQGILDTLAPSPPPPGVYNAAGLFSSQGILTPELSSLLKANPGLSGAIAGDLLDQGLVGRLISTVA